MSERLGLDGQVTAVQRQRWIVYGILVVILLVAAALRLYRLDEIPPGVTHDEADTGYFAAAVYRGAPSRVETPYGYANELYTMYSGAIAMVLFGPTDLALRLHSVFYGMAMLVLGYLWARVAFDTPTALGAMALAAVSYWPLSTARFALNSPPAPALFTGAIWALWLALFTDRPARSRWWAWLLFALFLAGSLWTYEVARAVVVAVFAFFGLLLLTDRARMRRRGLWFLGALTLGMALAAPHLFDPAAWKRSSALTTTLDALRAGNPGPILGTTIEALGTLMVKGDPFITYSLPGRPIFGPVVALCFCGGVWLCLRRWRRPACAFTLLWIGAGLVPSAIIGAWNGTTHSLGMQSVVFLPAALFVVETCRWAGRRYGPRAVRLIIALSLVLIAFTGVLTFRDYFLRWGESSEVRAAYFNNTVAMADYLDETEYSGAVALSAPFPDLPLDPFIADMRLHRDDLTVRWFDARRALVFPAASRSLLVLPPSTPLDGRFAERLDLHLVERVHLRPDDVDPYFDVFEWNPNADLDRFTGSTSVTVTVGGASAALPVDLGGVELVAYDLLTREVTPGGTAALITLWHVRDADALGPVAPEHYGRSAALFLHVLDAEDVIVGQEDRLDAPAWNWRSGDAFAQLHHVQLGTELAPGSYRVAVGLYNRHTMERLPAVVEGVEAGDRVFLQPLQVLGDD